MKLPLLSALDTKVAERCARTQAEHPWWPCASGCDGCCRSLPHLPTISAAEWERLAPAIAALPDHAAVAARITTMPTTAPVTCPLLGADGRCRVYEARPIACRTYGFYTERDAGLHCAKVGDALAAHGADVVWGNGEAINDELRRLGEARDLRAWLSAAGGLPSPSKGTNP